VSGGEPGGAEVADVRGPLAVVGALQQCPGDLQVPLGDAGVAQCGVVVGADRVHPGPDGGLGPGAGPLQGAVGQVPCVAEVLRSAWTRLICPTRFQLDDRSPACWAWAAASPVCGSASD